MSGDSDSPEKNTVPPSGFRRPTALPVFWEWDGIGATTPVRVERRRCSVGAEFSAVLHWDRCRIWWQPTV